jgi:transcriptional regulator with XRE-family HTH domain
MCVAMPSTEPTANGIDWASWMRGLGAQVGRTREVLGLSQDQLARLAGVSQGSVSRLENGRGVSTPLVVVTKICSALRMGLSHLDPALLSFEARQIVESGMRLPDPREDAMFGLSPTHDPGVAELLRAYNRLGERQRRQLLAVLHATAAALAGQTGSDLASESKGLG